MGAPVVQLPRTLGGDGIRASFTLTAILDQRAGNIFLLPSSCLWRKTWQRLHPQRKSCWPPLASTTERLTRVEPLSGTPSAGNGMPLQWTQDRFGNGPVLDRFSVRVSRNGLLRALQVR